MKAIIISVNPPHAGNLVDGLKTIEWRTKPLPECKAYIYETKKNGGCGKVIGEVHIVGNTKCNTNEWFSNEFDLIIRGKVDVRFLEKYAAKNDGVVYANECKGAVRYNEPKALSEFWKPCTTDDHCYNCKSYIFDDELMHHTCHAEVTRPPQSFCYVEEL